MANSITGLEIPWPVEKCGLHWLQRSPFVSLKNYSRSMHANYPDIGSARPVSSTAHSDGVLPHSRSQMALRDTKISTKILVINLLLLLFVVEVTAEDGAAGVQAICSVATWRMCCQILRETVRSVAVWYWKVSMCSRGMWLNSFIFCSMMIMIIIIIMFIIIITIIIIIIVIMKTMIIMITII